MQTTEEAAIVARRTIGRSTLIASVVLPVFNEQRGIRPCYAGLTSVLGALPGTVQITFVDDGSQDGSWLEIAELGKADSKVGAMPF